MRDDNVKAMRDALIKAKDNFDEIGKNALIGQIDEDALTMVCASMSGLIAKAIAAPARTCDRDLSDMQSIWAEFCQWVRCSSLGCASNPSAEDAFEWLLAKANERGAE